MHRTETTRLRTALRRQRRGRGRRTRYPISLRHGVVMHARERLAAGEPLARIAASLEVSLSSLQRWVGADQPGQLRPVEVRGPVRAASTGVLVTASGLRVEGLDVEQLAALLSALV